MWFSFKFQCCSGGMQKLLVSAVLAIEKCIKDDAEIDKKKKNPSKFKIHLYFPSVIKYSSI